MIRESVNDRMKNDPALAAAYDSARQGYEADELARHPKEQPGRTVYALISIPYEGSIVLSEDTLEELKEEIEVMTRNGLASLEAIFYADIIEGEL